MTLYTKPKTCRQCKTKFSPVRPLQQVCSPNCALEYGKAKTYKIVASALKDERKETRQKLDAMRTKPQLVKLAEKAFNAFIRARDAGKPCISCGKPLGTEANTHDAGHYRSVGSAPHMRFVEQNVHGQCKHCNRYLAGNHVAYRSGLFERLGVQEVERLERDQTLRRYTKEALIQMALEYREKARQLKKETA